MRQQHLLFFILLGIFAFPFSIQAQTTCTDFAVVVGNWSDASLQRFDGSSGTYEKQLTSGVGQRINSVMQYPKPNGNLYLGGYEEVKVVDAFTGALKFSFSGGPFSGLTEQIVVGADGNIYVANEGVNASSGSIARYNPTTGVYIDTFISFLSYQPNGLAQDAAGNWYVGTRNSPNEVRKYSNTGAFLGVVTTMGTTTVGGGLKIFNNELYVVTTNSPQTVEVYSLPVTNFPATPVRTITTAGSTYVGIDFGPDNNLYLAEYNGGKISVWNPTTGAAVTTLTNSKIPNPHGIGFTTCEPTCAITLKPNVSGCYSVTGASKATVSIEVAWSNAPAGKNIIVIYAGQPRTIVPGPYTSSGGSGTIVSPQVVAFEVDANGATGQTASATFETTSCSAVSPSFSLPAACPPTPCTGDNLGGTVFNDYNADGLRTKGETVGIPGVIVNAYDCAGTLVGTATSDAFGRYSMTAIQASSYPVRVEFTNLPAYAGQGTLNGANGRTTVQFVNAPDCNVDLGVLDPTDYCQTNPQLVIPCYVNGDPLAGGSSATSDAVVAFNYNSSGANSPSVSSHAIASDVGTLWGMAYNKFTRKIFSSAIVKRHAGLGPLGLGGLYVADFSTPPTSATFTYTPFLSVTALGVDVGTISDNVTRGLMGDKTQASEDMEGYMGAGKLGIGGIDLSEDGNKLYFTNLFDNKLYEIDITAYNTSGTLPSQTDVKSYTMSQGITATGGALHIWAVKVRKSKVYTGFVADAGTSQNKSDLRAYVQELNGNTVSTIFDFPLTYPKGFPSWTNKDVTGWFPWTDNWTTKIASGSNYIVHPEPILSSIEFDINGSMVLALGDRTGFQSGYQNYAPVNNFQLYDGIAGGDILRAYSNGTSFVLENNAQAGPSVGYGPGNNQGPGFGEFYNDDFNTPDLVGLTHSENSLGGLALRPGSGEVVNVVMDPIDQGEPGFDTWSGGIRFLDNTTGLTNKAFLIYASKISGGPILGTFGKASGLGDAVLACDVPTYLEIGNRLWVDLDKDGIQDPCEKALAGVKVALYQGTTLLANTTTDANGEYYFSNGSDVNAVSRLLLPNTTYTVRFGTDGTTSQYDNTTGILLVDGGKYNVTTAFSTAPTANTLNDSNAQLSGGFLSASVTTSAYGSVNHTIDAGFYCVPTTVASVSVVKATCTGATANNDGQVLVTGIVCADKVFLVSAGGAIPSYTATGSQPVSNSTATFTGLTNPSSSAGQSYSIVLYNGPCCYTVVTALLPQQTCLTCNIAILAEPSKCNPATNAYSVSGSISLTSAIDGIATITDGLVSTTVAISTSTTSVDYTLTGLVSDGASHTVTVNLPGCGVASDVYDAPSSCTVAASIVVISATVCYGSSATLTASGCSGTVTWSNNTTGNTLVTPALTATTDYTATCTTSTGSTTFAVGTATVMPQPILSLQASSTLVTVGTPVSLSAIGCVGTLTWSTNQSGSVISVTPTNPTNTYSATCTTGPGCTTIASITVNTAPSASLVVISATVCYGSSATLTASGCSGTVTWSDNTTGNTLVTPALTASTDYTATCTTSTGSTTFAVGTATVLPQPILSLQASSTLVTVGTPVSLSAIGCVGTLTWSTNQSGNTISVTPTNPTNTYSATCTTGPGCTIIASITVNTAPSASLVVISATVCYGSSATLTASGCSGTVTWSNNTTGNSLVTPALTASTNYTATCTTSTGSTTFAVGTATVMPQPVLSLQASSTLVTVGTPVSLSAIGCVGTLSWSTNQSGSVISVTPTNPTNVYSATCTTGPGCTTIASITVNTAPSASLVVISATVCYGSSATLTASGCSGTVTWSNNTTGNTLVTPALTATTDYTATCTTSTGSTTFAVGTATVMPQPILSLQASSTLVTVGTPVSLSAIGCVGTLSWSTNQSGNTISVTPTNPTNTYSATCTTGPGCTTIASITVNTAPSASLVVISATVCYGSSATLTASGCSGTVTWSNNTTGNTLVTPALTASTNYTATCTTSTGSTTFAVGTATVMPQPIVSLQASSTLVTVGTPVSLSAIGCVGTLTWSTNQSGSVISVTPTNPTNTYSATCTTGPGCTTIASITVNTAPSASLVVISATVCYGSSATLTASGCSGTVTWSNNTTGNTLVTPALTASTNYTATCTTSTGSTTFAVGTATVMPQPIVNLSAIRSGNSLTLTANGCVGSLQWSTGATTTDITINVTATTLFSVTCTTGLNCKATARKQIGFVPVVLDVVTSSGQICSGQSVTITAGNCGANLLWSTGATTESILVSPSLTTNYSVLCSDDLNSVSASTSVTVMPELSTSLTATAISSACNAATNQYMVTGTISATNLTGNLSLTISVGSINTSVTLTGNGPVSYTLPGLNSDGLVKTVSISSSTLTCGLASVTYTAPTCPTTCAPPIHVCKGTDYAIRLNTPTGQTSYQWYRNGVAISNATLSSYTATQAGSYSVVVNGNVVDQCLGGSCCPIIIVEDSIATYQAVAQVPTCNTATNSTANADGRILVTNWKLSVSDTTQYFYQVSLGSSFNAAQLIAGSATSSVPTNGVLVNNLANPTSVTGQTYTVRISNKLGCYKDVMVILLPTTCSCPPAKCLPIVVQKIR